MHIGQGGDVQCIPDVQHAYPAQCSVGDDQQQRAGAAQRGDRKLKRLHLMRR